MGQFEITYKGPYKGINVMMPETELEANYSPSLSNVILKNGEIRSRQRISALLPSPDQYPVRGLVTFVDTNTVFHTCCLTQFGLYQLSYAWRDLLLNNKNPWLSIGTFNKTVGKGLFSHAILANKLFFTNGSNTLYYWDGMQNNIQTATSVAGGLFIFELDARLCLVNTTENINGADVKFPQRTRWSASGVVIDVAPGDAWNPSVNIGAGFNDSLDVPDAITNAVPMGRIAYLFRTNGITEMTPVGGSKVFDFNHLWAADRGIGNVYAQAVGNYGSFCIFPSSEGIHKLTPSSLTEIGGGATDQIYSNLNKATSCILGTILPYFSPQYIYPVYFLSIPIGSNTICWLYDIKMNYWVTWTLSNRTITTRPRYVYVS